jgi:hypothetical protein
MKKFLPLLGAIALVSLLAGLNGCILETKELTIVITDYVCTGFEENHDDENYTDHTASLDDSFFEDLDDILADNDMTKDDVEGASVVGVYYQLVDGPTNPPWTVSGAVWVSVDGADPVLVASYQSVVLDTEVSSPADPVRIDTEPAGLQALNEAIQQYLSASDPGGYPDIVFYSGMEDIDPSPAPGSEFVLLWNGCLSMKVSFTEEYEVYDLFPGD